MWPVLFQLGDVSVYSYGVCSLLGVFAGAATAVVLALRLRASLTKAVFIVLLVPLAALLGAKVGYALVTGGPFVNGGMFETPGVIAGALATLLLALALKERIGTAFDVMCPAMAAFAGFGRLGCFFAGCCPGRPTSLPWGVHLGAAMLPPELAGQALHPAQLYLAVSWLLLLAGLVAYARAGRRAGELALLTVLGAAAVHLAVDLPFRYQSPVLAAGLWAVGGAGALTFFLLWRGPKLEGQGHAL